MRPRRRPAAMPAALLVLALLGCRERAPDPEPREWRGPPPVTEVEKRRGVAACADYKKKVCDCAARDPRRAQDCRMADSRSGALELSLRIAAAERDDDGEGGDDSSSRALAISNARKVMRRCIEQVAELARGCPEPSEVAPEADTEAEAEAP